MSNVQEKLDSLKSQLMEIQKRLSVLACRWSRRPHNSICKWGLQSHPVFHPQRKWCQTLFPGLQMRLRVLCECQPGAWGWSTRVCVCVCVCILVCLIMFYSATTMDCSLPGSSVHNISQARILGWIAISFAYMYICACIHIYAHTNVSNYLVKHFSRLP